MDMLKRTLAPLTLSAWDEIDGRAEEVLKSCLTARKAVKVNGPMGWDFAALSEGRLDLLEKKDTEVASGVFKVKPLVEVRVSFTLNRWEMDNVTRGAKDIDLRNLEDAVKKIAEFEEKAVYKGFKEGHIKGLSDASAHKKIPFGTTGSEIMEAISKGLLDLKDHFAEAPFVLIVGSEVYKRLNTGTQVYPLFRQIESLIGGKIILNPTIEGAFLFPYNNKNFELTIGQDFAIGYDSHSGETVKLYITESFTFRVLDGNIIVSYTI